MARAAVGRRLDPLAWRILWGRVERAPVAYPPGHFYSPIPSQRDVDASAPIEIRTIDLRAEQQLATLERLNVEAPTGPRWKPGNKFFGPLDTAIYEAVIRHHQPERVVEVGCGWSTAALFDAGGARHVTLIEPSPARLRRVLSLDDLARCELVEARLQDVPLSTFEALNAGDVLFIDSTHVAKLGSDVNRIFFEILPALASGVIVHFHDVFYPFEYVDEWAREGRAWNEAYLLRAFLEYNSAFEIMLWADMLVALGHLSGRGASIWLRKIQ